MPQSYRILAPAKVNLRLEVLGLLPGGYHELDTVFCWLELADELRWREAERVSLSMSGVRGEPIETGESNLVLRALRLLERKVGRALPLAIEVEKRIPAGGGLAGGSSDAAALLYGVNQSHHLGIELSVLQQWGGEIGADVAFCVAGGTARGQGRGEVLTPLPPPPPLPVILACPPFGCPTPEIYRRWDQAPPRAATEPSVGVLVERLSEAISRRQGADWRDLLDNDLQSAAEDYRHELVDVRHSLLAAGCTHALLCGSGSTVFGLVPEGQIEAILARLPRQDGVVYEASRLWGRPRPEFAALESS